MTRVVDQSEAVADAPVSSTESISTAQPRPQGKGGGVVRAFATTIRAMRLHQWVKNLLVFVPVFTSHRMMVASEIGEAWAAFFAFGLVASGIYIFNDLMDVASDRLHPTKRNRPIASGALPTSAAMILSPAMVIAGFVISVPLGLRFVIALAAYMVISIAYSLFLKHRLLVDVFTLSGLYVLRVLAGSAATGIPCTDWLLAFSLFFFLSLALAKRFAELQRSEGLREVRKYKHSDLQVLGSLGTGSGFLCVVVLALYIESEDRNPAYHTPMVLWLLCPLIMYWISRVWIFAFRGVLNEDPVVFALRDKVSYLAGVAALVLVWAAEWDWPVF